MWGRCGVDVASICSRCRVDVGSIGGRCINKEINKSTRRRWGKINIVERGGNSRMGKENNKILEEGMKTLRRENNKIVEEGIKTLRREINKIVEEEGNKN